MDVIVPVAVAVAVGAPVILAALGNGIDIVKVIDRRLTIRLVHGMDHGHGSVPAHERGNDQGRVHVHANDYGNVSGRGVGRRR